MTVRRLPHRFTVAEYETMIDQGILKEDARVELIRGEIVAKMPVGDAPIACVDRLTRLMFLAVGDTVTVSVQNPIRLADSEPEPDLVLKRREVRGKPGPADVLLVVEVAESSLDDDREVPGPLYAENGVAEFWLVNLIDGQVEVYRSPRPVGGYADARVARPGDRIEVAALPGVTVDVAELLGP